MELAEILEKFREHRGFNTHEGRRGVENLCKLVHSMGYVDSQHFGQFVGGSYGDLIEFLEDNPGCVEAIHTWIAQQNIPEWKDNLDAELPETVKQYYDDGACPDCGDDIPDDATAGDECGNCGHAFLGEDFD